jgi:hypothetical protein
MIELSVDGALPGDEIVVERKRKLRVRARAWGHPERSRPAVLEIVQHGEVIRRGEPAGAGANEIALEFEIDAGQGSWLAARVRADNDTHAHTTPVYVVRKGLRFWKFDQTEELIAKRLASLDEVRQMCRDAKAQLERGELEADQTRRELALQADALLERVDAAADIYQQLQEAAEHERDIRQSMN